LFRSSLLQKYTTVCDLVQLDCSITDGYPEARSRTEIPESEKGPTEQPIPAAAPTEAILASLSPEDQDLERAAPEYDANISLVKMYFYLEPLEIEAQAAAAQSSTDIQHVWHNKRVILEASQQFDIVRRQLPNETACVLFLFVVECAITMAAGILINILNIYALLVGSMLVIIYFTLVLMKQARTLYNATEALSREQDILRVIKQMLREGLLTEEHTSP
jgi:hypothetical protein